MFQKCMDKRDIAMEAHNNELGLVIDVYLNAYNFNSARLLFKALFNWCKTASTKGMQSVILVLIFVSLTLFFAFLDYREHQKITYHLRDRWKETQRH